MSPTTSTWRPARGRRRRRGRPRVHRLQCRPAGRRRKARGRWPGAQRRRSRGRPVERRRPGLVPQDLDRQHPVGVRGLRDADPHRPATGQPHGVLASSWTLAKDAKSMDLKLRDDVTFHSGRKLTADDVIFTIQKAQDPKTGAANQSIAGQISHVEKKGDDEVTLTFKQPLPNIFDLFETMPILNKDTYGDYAAGRTSTAPGASCGSRGPRAARSCSASTRTTATPRTPISTPSRSTSSRTRPR